MKISRLSIPDVLVIEPQIFSDERGFFLETFNQNRFDKIFGNNIKFVQDNYSSSKKGVLRGLHYQKAPRAQGKLIKVINGEIFDVAVDLRKESATFGNWTSEILSKENNKQLWIPEGFAHGFLVLSDNADVIYKTTDFYSLDNERCIKFDDPTIGVIWPNMDKYTLSKKDLEGLSLNQCLES